MAATVTLSDGRTFPTHNGEVLSWSIGSSFTAQDQAEGYPRTRAIIAAFMEHRPEQLAAERNELRKACSDRLFGHNAKRLLALIDD